MVVEARLPYVTDGDGMHTFTDPADGERYVRRTLGMDIAQRVFACFDQPDLKAPDHARGHRRPRWTVLANGGATATRTAAGGTFATTPPISTYLFVVCAGPWHSVTWEHAGLPFGWHARRSLAAELDRDAEELRQITEAASTTTPDSSTSRTRSTPTTRCSCPELNWGAMETPGCVTFRDEYAAARPGHRRPSGGSAPW